jgi:hypothetical protein
MTDQKVLSEIEKAILEEQESELLEARKAEKKALENDAQALPQYLTDNTVKLPLSDFLILHQQAQLLDKLVTLFLNNADLDYTRKTLRFNNYAPNDICKEIKTYFPSEYIERFNELLNEKE